MIMFKKIMILMGLTFLIIPTTVNAEDTVVYDQANDYLIANGNAITINEENGQTIATWDGGSQVLTNNSTIIGGAYNPEVDVNYNSTNITMNGGTIKTIIGGNFVTANYDSYNTIKVGTINITINGGNVTNAIFGLTSGNTALGSKYYDIIRDYYTADTVNITIDNATVAATISTSSYTYIQNYNITVGNNAKLTDPDYAISLGSNGVVDNAIVNIDNSTVENISSGNRAMIGSWTLNITGTSTIGNIYAGSNYPNGESASTSNNWSNWSAGYVNYGQVGNMIFTLGENVTYNNIYAGFQYLDKEAFFNKYATDGVLPNYATGIEGSDQASVTINIKTAPLVPSTENDTLYSMINDYQENYITVNYTPTANVEVIDPNEEVEVVTPGVANSNEAEEVLGNVTIENEDALEAIANGNDVTIEIVTTPIEESTNAILFEENISPNYTILGYFDISILIKNDSIVYGNVSEVEAPITLIAILPNDLSPVKEGYQRTYYILRSHDGKITKLEAILSEDGKYVTFASDKFSEYALVYTDTKINIPSEQIPTTNDNEIMPPKTYDNISVTLITAIVTLIGLIISSYQIKKNLHN